LEATRGPSTGTGERFKDVARGGLRLREGPGTDFDVIGGLRPVQIVFVQFVAVARGPDRPCAPGVGVHPQLRAITAATS